MKHNLILALAVPVVFGLLSWGLTLGGGGGDGDGVDILPYLPGKALTKAPPGGGGGRAQIRPDDGTDGAPDMSGGMGAFFSRPRRGVVFFGLGQVPVDRSGGLDPGNLVRTNQTMRVVPYSGSLRQVMRDALDLARSGMVPTAAHTAPGTCSGGEILAGQDAFLGLVTIERGRPALLTVIAVEIGSGRAPTLWCVPLPR